MRYLLFASLLSAFACGGPRKPGVQGDATYFWRVDSSTVEFNSSCSDDPAFRMQNPPIKVDTKEEDTNNNGVLDPGEDLDMDGMLDHPNFVVYKAAADARKVTMMTCTQLDPKTCTPASTMVVLDVASTELTFSDERKTPTMRGMCNLLDTQSWLLTDQGEKLDMAISDTFSLVDDMTACDQIEAAAKMKAPNGMGYRGCTITFHVGATYEYL